MRTLKGLEAFQWYKIFISISGNFSFQTLGQPKPINNHVLKDLYSMISLICGILKVQKLMNITKKEQAHRYKETSGYQWQKEGGGANNRGEDLKVQSH